MTPEPRNAELWKITLGELDEKMGVKIIEESVERVVATMPGEGNRQSFGLLHGGGPLAVVAAVGPGVWVTAMSIPFWNVRPHVFSLLFVAASLYLLLRSRGRADRWLWLLPAIMVAWVNLHAGYVMGLLLPVLFLIGELFNRIRHARLKDDEARPGATGARQYLAVLLATLAATVANPQGPAILLNPFHSAGTQNASMKFITEWQTPAFHEY